MDRALGQASSSRLRQEEGVPIMGRFYALYVRRSDGQTHTNTRGKEKEENRPTKDQLDSTPDKNGTSDYYRLVGVDEPKHLDWRRKLGGLLARELDLDPSKAYILASFPEKYHLYEHVKTVRKGDGEAPKTKTHAGGGNDRQDAYLYGHPWGRKKRYRSPADFFHHLLWLSTNEKEKPDTDDCCCKICTPEELDAPVKDMDKDQRHDQGIRDDRVAPGSRRSSVQPSRLSNTPTPGPSLTANTLVQRAPAPTTARVVPQPAPRPTPAPATPQQIPRNISRPMDYNFDSRYDLFVFRQGEMVWYDRRVAWGLGVITERWKVHTKSHYRVQPLSWPGNETDSIEISNDTDLRPWLAWSVPPFTHENLNKAAVALTYDTFDFAGLSAGNYGIGNVEIDASILAAKAIDASWTTFAPESRTEPQQGVIEVCWGGIYFGAEKIWVNDPVRLQNNRVLVVRQILERNQKSAFNAQSWSSITITGDVFVLQVLQHVNFNNVQNGIVQGTEYPGLPSRMLEDIRRRNNFTVPTTGMACCWKPYQASATYELKDIRGRWYEATLLSPILLAGQSPSFETKAHRGDVPEGVAMMNGRGDCNTKDGQRMIPDSRKQKREQAFGRAVPARTVIVDGINNTPAPQQTQQLPPRQPPQPPRVGSSFQAANGTAVPPQATAQTQVMNDSGASFEEFMDLDSMSGGDMMSGFDQSYL